MNRYLTTLGLILFILVSINACTFRQYNSASSEEAISILASIRQANTSLKTFKGIGSVKLTKNGLPNSFRLAWAGTSPDKLRLTVLTAGRPLETFSTDGTNVYIKSHTNQHAFIHHRSTNTSLKKIINIPVKTKDVILLLRGGIPVANHKHVKLSLNDQGYILELFKPWRGLVERIHLNKNKRAIGFEVINNGNVQYKVLLSNYIKMATFNLPGNIDIATKQVSCKITISKYLPNTDVSPELFKLNE